jgi:uncharacterized membrane protein YgaE (UPF0421/DUF939 family)
MYETVASGLQRVASVVAGVLIAVGFATWVGLNWWSLGFVVAASLITGRLLHLGDHLLEVPISAMLVLAVGGAKAPALDRVYETLIGAAVGVVVNVVIAAPLYVQPASDAIGELAERMAQFLRTLADQLGASATKLTTPTGPLPEHRTAPGSTHALPRPGRHYRGCASG